MKAMSPSSYCPPDSLPHALFMDSSFASITLLAAATSGFPEPGLRNLLAPANQKPTN
jgi:hypothetical protein